MDTKFKIEIEEIAKNEIIDAFEWYENQQIGLGNDFLQALEFAFRDIQRTPKGYRKYKYHRQYPLISFSYVVLYEIVGDTLYIDAVFHTKRNPSDKIL